MGRPAGIRYLPNESAVRLTAGGVELTNAAGRVEWGGSVVETQLCHCGVPRCSGEGLATVVRVGDQPDARLAFLPPSPWRLADAAFVDDTFAHVVLLTPSEWDAAVPDEVPRAGHFPVWTRGDLWHAWRACGPLAGPRWEEDDPPSGADRLWVRRVGEVLLAADPGEPDAARTLLRRLHAWAEADPNAPAPGTLTPPSGSTDPLTLYLDGPGLPAWPAFITAGTGVALGGWTFTPAGGW